MGYFFKVEKRTGVLATMAGCFFTLSVLQALVFYNTVIIGGVYAC